MHIFLLSKYFKGIQIELQELCSELVGDWVNWKREKKKQIKHIQPNLSSQGHFQLRD